MWSLIQNNAVMAAIVAAVVLVSLLLHVGVYIVIRKLMRRDVSAGDGVD